MIFVQNAAAYSTKAVVSMAMLLGRQVRFAGDESLEVNCLMGMEETGIACVRAAKARARISHQKRLKALAAEWAIRYLWYG